MKLAEVSRPTAVLSKLAPAEGLSASLRLQHCKNSLIQKKNQDHTDIFTHYIEIMASKDCKNYQLRVAFFSCKVTMPLRLLACLSPYFSAAQFAAHLQVQCG